MAVAAYEYHRPREATISVSLSPDFSGDHIAPGVADEVTINAAIVEAVTLGIGEVVLLQGGYALTATVNAPANLFLRGTGWSTILNYDAGGNCITITGDNVKIRDLKIVITAGAGGAGTRPNGIFADTRTNIEVSKVWLIGDETVADDGSNVRQCGIIFDTVTNSWISSCRSEDNRRHGFFFNSGSDNSVTENICTGNTRFGIYYSSGSDNSVTENICCGNAQDGIRFNVMTDNSLMGNICNGNVEQGIDLIASLGNSVVGNTCQENTRHGMLIDDSSENTIVGNTCNENDSGDTGTYDGINITDISLDNLVHSNTCNDNDRYGINIDDVRALRNWVKNNQLRGNTSGPFNDDIANLTKLATIPIPLVQGTTFISTADEAWGWRLNADTNFALGIGWLPLEVQQVVRIRIIGVALAAPGAGDYMRIQITGEGATFAEDFETEPIDVVDHNNEEVNVQVDEAVNWIFTAADDADIGHLLGGDRLQIKVLHEDAGNGDAETNAIVDTVQIEYV